MHWQQQLELKENGILTNGYYVVKRREYARRRNAIVLARKQREGARADMKCPQGRIDHLVDQTMRIIGHV